MDILQHARAQSKLTLEETKEQTRDAQERKREKEKEHVTTPILEHLFDLFARILLPPEMYSVLYTHADRYERI